MCPAGLHAGGTGRESPARGVGSALGRRPRSRCESGGGAGCGPAKRRSRAGTEPWCRWTGASRGKNLRRPHLVASDISARLQQENEREQLLARERAARADAERSNRLKEEFLATLSHELRNPLNAISGWASVLQHTPNLAPEVTNAIAGIQRNCKLQANMISDLLDYAGITFGKMRVVCRLTAPYSAVRAALDIMQPIAEASGIELQATFEPEHLRVLADPERLQQIVWNLLSNAIKFSVKGGVVRLTAGSRGGHFRLTVEDHGAGISPEFLPRVFDRFSQGDASITRRHAGLGIGLAIVKQLVEMQQGTITPPARAQARVRPSPSNCP